MNNNEKLKEAQKLPGLSGDFSEYPIIGNNSERFRMIPFTDWLPPDFQEVPCSRGGFYMLMWYSPIKNRMVFADSHDEMEVSELSTWLRKEVE